MILLVISLAIAWLILAEPKVALAPLRAWELCRGISRAANVWLMLKYVWHRERVRDWILIRRGTPLYVRCAHYLRWRPCRNDASTSIGHNEFPIECDVCAGRDVSDGTSVHVPKRLRAACFAPLSEVMRIHEEESRKYE